MKIFLRNIFWFILPFLFFFIVGLFLPTTPRASKSLLFASLKKDSLLINTPAPRIIFVGGSNLSFGLNSRMIKDSLGLNPINTAIHAILGMKYIMESTIPYIKEGDVVILAPEYSHFFQTYYMGSEELLRIIFDVDFSKIKLLNIWQIINTISYIPKYCISKFDFSEYVNVKEDEIYGVNSFNEFGDTYTHWGKDRDKFNPQKLPKEGYNPKIIKGILSYKKEIEQKKAQLYITYPGFQDISFLSFDTYIKKVEEVYKENNLLVLGTPARYMMPDSLMFNTPYHLLKEGVDYRTALFIEDFKKAYTKR